MIFPQLFNKMHLIFYLRMDGGFGINPNSSISQLENIFANPFRQQKPKSDSDVEAKVFKFFINLFIRIF